MKDDEKNILTLQIIGVYCNFGGKKNMKFYGLVDANNKPFGRLLPVEIQVIIMFWASVAETNDKRKKVLAQLVRIPVCRNTHIPKYVNITRQGFQRWYRTVLVPFGNFNQCPHCSRRQEQQVSVSVLPPGLEHDMTSQLKTTFVFLAS